MFLFVTPSITRLLCSSLANEAESVSLLLKPRLVSWLALGNKMIMLPVLIVGNLVSKVRVCIPELKRHYVPLQFLCSSDITMRICPSRHAVGWETCGAELSHPSHPGSLEKQIADTPGTLWVNQSRFQSCLPNSEWPQGHEQQTLIIICRSVFVAIC